MEFHWFFLKFKDSFAEQNNSDIKALKFFLWSLLSFFQSFVYLWLLLTGTSNVMLKRNNIQWLLSDRYRLLGSLVYFILFHSRSLWRETQVKNKVLTSHTIKGYNVLYDSPETTSGWNPFAINPSRLGVAVGWAGFWSIEFYFFLLIEHIPQQCSIENDKLLISIYKWNRKGDNLSDSIWSKIGLRRITESEIWTSNTSWNNIDFMPTCHSIPVSGLAP